MERSHRIEVQSNLIKYLGQAAPCGPRVRYFLTLLAGPFVTSIVSYFDRTSRAMPVRSLQRVAYCRKRARLSAVAESLIAAPLMVER